MRGSSGAVRKRFMADHMVVRLGKYLRILGYDAEWDLRLRTHELILRANVEGRVFLTRNRHLDGRYPAPAGVVYLGSSDPVEQFRQVVGEQRLETGAFLFSRCIRCNVGLMQVERKEEIRNAVHPNVYAGYDRFYTCPDCGTVFWHGSHVRNTRRKLGLDSQHL